MWSTLLSLVHVLRVLMLIFILIRQSLSSSYLCSYIIEVVLFGYSCVICSLMMGSRITYWYVYYAEATSTLKSPSLSHYSADWLNTLGRWIVFLLFNSWAKRSEVRPTINHMLDDLLLFWHFEKPTLLLEGLSSFVWWKSRYCWKYW